MVSIRDQCLRYSQVDGWNSRHQLNLNVNFARLKLVLEVPFDMENDCEITENGFHLANKFDPAIENIGLNVTIGNGGVKIDECHK